MEIIGIICEYNPFHNGHIYHIKKIKERYPNSILILCLNGYFLERGEISILKKEDKVKLALSYGVDIVIELPLFYGVQSADYFADASIFLLHAIGVTHIVFGSEQTNIATLSKIAEKQLNKSLEKENTGRSYPARISEKYYLPNTLLAISYIKSIIKYGYSILPVAIQRTNSYHDTLLDNTIVSASNIREKLKEKKDVSFYLPKEALENILTVNEKLYFDLLKHQILIDPHLENKIDVIEGLEHKLKKEITSATSIESLVTSLKSKRYTYNKIRRMLLHILLGIKKEPMEITYLHILGFNEKGQNYIKQNKKNFTLPTKVDTTSKLYQYEILGARIYDMLTNTNSSSFDIRNIPIKYTPN